MWPSSSRPFPRLSLQENLIKNSRRDSIALPLYHQRGLTFRSTLQERIDAVGVTAFTIINALPRLFVTFLLVHEILREDVRVGSVLLLFAIFPAVYQAVCEAWGKREILAQEDAQPQMETGDNVNSVRGISTT